jgi:hypothetical protein
MISLMAMQSNSVHWPDFDVCPDEARSSTGGGDREYLSYAIVLKTNVEDLAVFRKWMRDALMGLSATIVESQLISCRSIRISEHR